MDADVQAPGPDLDAFVARVKIAMGRENVHAFSRRSGIKDSTLRSILDGREPSMSKVQRIAEATGYTLKWLITGEGPMREGDLPAVAQGGAVFTAETLPDGYILLPRYGVQAAAGGGAVVDSEQVVDHLAFRRDWIIYRLRRNPASLILIEAMGDSMEPTIANGDLLLVDTAEAQLRDNAIYALSLGGTLIVKRLQRRISGAVSVISDNDRYAPEEVSPAEASTLHVVGQVVWHAGLV